MVRWRRSSGQEVDLEQQVHEYREVPGPVEVKYVEKEMGVEKVVNLTGILHDEVEYAGGIKDRNMSNLTGTLHEKVEYAGGDKKGMEGDGSLGRVGELEVE